MSEAGTQRFLAQSQETRFLRMDFGEGNQRHTERLDIDPAVLAQEKRHLEPFRYAAFRDALGTAQNPNGWADSLCAVVSGLPVSYFTDVYLVGDDLVEFEDGEIFPRPAFARWSEVGVRGDERPIGGTEDPLSMTHRHRADFVPKDGAGKYRHFNHMDSNSWNTLWMCFLPAKFELLAGEMRKTRNAFCHTRVNGNDVFNGFVKTGTRSARRTANQNPERDLYVAGNTDKKIRLLGHWGSTVMFKDIQLRSLGSE